MPCSIPSKYSAYIAPMALCPSARWPKGLMRAPSSTKKLATATPSLVFQLIGEELEELLN